MIVNAGGEEEMGLGDDYWHMSSGASLREPPICASATALNANASASSCVRFDACALSRSLILWLADCSSSPRDLSVPAASTHYCTRW